VDLFEDLQDADVRRAARAAQGSLGSRAARKDLVIPRGFSALESVQNAADGNTGGTSIGAIAESADKLSKWETTMRNWTTFLAALILVLAAPTASAQSTGFTHTVEAYFMGASMSGTTGAGPVTGEVDLTSSKILENLQFGAMADYRGEAPKWAVGADVVYMGLGASGTGDGGRATAKVDMDEWMVEATGSYRFSPVFEAVGGARYTSLSTTFELRTGQATRTAKASADWVDPIVGARLALPVSEAFAFTMRGMFGGFGVGCDFTWDVDARVKWHASKTVDLSVGFRYLDQDYEKDGGFVWDVVSQGPLVAASLKF
jgi:hypothetical protein